MELDVAEAEGFCLLLNIVDRRVDKDADTLALGQIGRHFAHEARRTFPTDEAHHIDADAFHFADVIGIPHPANLDDGFHRLNRVNGGNGLRINGQ